MMAANAWRLTKVAEIGADDDMGGIKRAGYNAAGYGAVGVVALCGIDQLNLIATMIEGDRDSEQ